MRARQFAAFFAVGSGFVVLGGLVAAVTGPLHLPLGSWLAAYLVLVCGAAQCAVAAVQNTFLDRPVPSRVFAAELVLWNLANLATIVGTLLGLTTLARLGGLALVVALLLALVVSRWARRAPLVWVYRGCLVVMLVSIPIGLFLLS